MGSNAPKAGGQHKIVCLDAYMCAVPKFNFPHEYVEFDNTIGEKQTIERAKDATIVITTRAGLTAETFSHCPRLEFIAVMGAGTNFLDTAAARKRNIPVCNCPSASAEAVAEHAFALYLAAKKRIVDLHHAILEGTDWPKYISGFRFYSSPPRVSRHETLGIIGYGGLGKNIETIAKALGMKVLVAERKGVEGTNVRAGRTSFEEVLKSCTVLMIGCPLDDETRNMFTAIELQKMRKDGMLINVARGGIVNEDDLVKALNDGWIAAAATDVFVTEPATADTSPLIRNCPPNLTLSPHTAWYADVSIERLQVMIKSVVEGYVSGSIQNVVN
ncbi:putative Glycerate dehydrogenase [Seiridium cardinale]|uniref:Glycerate dehydrogenase n=1 Tax=Seiridium cardinale TaxID=138064 RepID=A0ABR2XYM0_9PEZI